MKNLKIVLSMLILSIAALLQPLWADNRPEMDHSSAPTTIELTLPKAEQLALKRNPLIHAADKREDAASKQKLQTLAPADPTFMIERDGESGGPLNLDGPGVNTWMVSEDLGFPGQSLVKVDVDNAETAKQKAMADDARRLILLQTRQTFWEFYYRQKVFGILDEAQKQWKILSQGLRSRELTGQWLSMKTVRAQMEIANSTNDLFTASQSLEVSRVHFNNLFDLPMDTGFTLKEVPDLAAINGTLEGYIQKARDDNPKVEAAQREVDEKTAEAHVAAFSHLPDFNIRLMGTRNPDDTAFSSYAVRLGVSIPLFFPMKQTQAADQANDLADASRFELTARWDETHHMVEESYINAQSAWRLWKLYQEGGLLEQAQRAWKATELAYRNEQISLSDFVDNYNLYLETLESYYKAQADYGKALAEFHYQIGDLPVAGNEKE
ncbi:MAG: TolC family protein [bacterium]